MIDAWGKDAMHADGRKAGKAWVCDECGGYLQAYHTYDPQTDEAGFSIEGHKDDCPKEIRKREAEAR